MPELETLRTMAESEDFYTRIRAVKLMGESDDPAVGEMLQKYTQDSDISIRYRARKSLEKFNNNLSLSEEKQEEDQDQDCLEDQLIRLESETPEVRIEAATSLAKLDNPDLIAPVVKKLSKEQDINVADALVKTLEALCGDDSTGSADCDRANTAGTATAVQLKEIFKAISPLLSNQNKEVVTNAARTLWKFSRLKTAGLLREMIHGPDPKTRKNAVTALEAIGSPETDRIIARLHGERVPETVAQEPRIIVKPEDRVSAEEPAPSPVEDIPDDVQELKKSIYRSRLIRDLDSENEELREWAVQLAGKLKDRSLVPLLVKRLGMETSTTVIASLVKTLGSLGDSSLISHLVFFLDHPDPEVRANTIEGLVLVEDQDLTRHIHPLLDDNDRRVRAIAATCLWKINPSSVKTRLLQMLASPDYKDIIRARGIIGYIDDSSLKSLLADESGKTGFEEIVIKAKEVPSTARPKPGSHWDRRHIMWFFLAMAVAASVVYLIIHVVFVGDKEDRSPRETLVMEPSSVPAEPVPLPSSETGEEPVVSLPPPEKQPVPTTGQTAGSSSLPEDKSAVLPDVNSPIPEPGTESVTTGSPAVSETGSETPPSSSAAIKELVLIPTLKVEPRPNRKRLKEKAFELLGQGDQESALELFVKLGQSPSPDPEDFYYAGHILMRQEHYQEAIDYFDRSLAVSPQYVDSHFMKGQALFSQGKIIECIDSYHRGLEQRPDDALAMAELAEVYIAGDDIQQAVGLLEQAIEYHSLPPPSQARLGDLYLSMGKVKKAGILAQDLIEKHSTSPYGYNLMGDVKLNSGNSQQAAQMYEKALGIRETPEGYRRLAEIHLSGNSFIQAQKSLTKLIEFSPHDGWAFLERGMLYRMFGELEAAIFDLEKALDLHNDDFRVNAHLADCYLIRNRYAEEAEHYRKALAGCSDQSLTDMLQRRLESAEEKQIPVSMDPPW